MKTVLALQDRWVLIGPEGAKPVPPYTSSGEDCCIVWLPPHTTGEATLQGDKSHAAALIERKELTSGTIDAESRVFVHSIWALDAAYQAAYSIAPLAPWLEISGWAKNQPRHTVISNPSALAWSQVKPGQAVVVQDGLTFAFWAVVRNRVLHHSLVAMGSQPEDTRFAADALGQQVHAALTNQGGFASADGTPGLSVVWLSVMREHNEEAHQAALQAFKDASSLEVNSRDLPYDTCSDLGVIASAMPGLTSPPSLESIIGPPGGKFLWRAEKWLPACSLVSVLAATGFLGLSIYWLAQAHQIDKHSEAVRAELALQSPAQIAPLNKPSGNAELNTQLAFITSMRQLQNSHDVENALQALKLSVRGGMRILGVRSIAEPGPKAKTANPAPTPALSRAFIVDGVLPDSNNHDVLLSQFIWSLGHSGYTAEAMDVASPAAASSTSTRLFSYRVYPTAPR